LLPQENTNLPGWGIEMGLKSPFPACWSGFSYVNNFYMPIFLYNRAIVATNNVQPDVNEAMKDKENKYNYHVSQNKAIGAMKDNFIRPLMNDEPEARAKMVDTILWLMFKSVTPRRPGRPYPRNKNPRKSKFNNNQKSNC
jgi:hypothetical protein